MDFIDNHGDVLDVVLRAPLWTDLYRGRIVGLLWYPSRGWCGWRFNHDGWVKWGCQISPRGLPRPTPVPSIMLMFSYFMLYIYNYLRMFTFYVYLYTYVYMFFKGKTSGLLSRSGSTSLRRQANPGKNVLKKRYKTTDKLLNFVY